MTRKEIKLPAGTSAGSFSKEELLRFLDKLECIGAVKSYTVTTTAKLVSSVSKGPVES